MSEELHQGIVLSGRLVPPIQEGIPKVEAQYHDIFGEPDYNLPSITARKNRFAKIIWEAIDMNQEHIKKQNLTLDKAYCVRHVGAEEIFENFHLLHSIVERHEATIQKRWIKKSREQRKRILLAAWPTMISCRPERQATLGSDRLRKEAVSTQCENSTENVDANRLLRPHINLHDLSNQRHLLLFINSRGRYSPDKFAVSDGRNYSMGLNTELFFSDERLDGCRMVFLGRDTADSYGTLVYCPKDPKDLKKWYQPLQVRLGLSILGEQVWIYSFLVRICKIILCDISERDLLSFKYPLQPEPLLSTKPVRSIAEISAESPYRLPSDLDLPRLESLIVTRLEAAEDHLWSLREDPGYLMDVLVEAKNHSSEYLFNGNGKKHSLLRCPNQWWARILVDVIYHALGDIELWGCATDKIRDVKILQLKYSEQIRADEKLPNELELGFLILQHHLRGLLDPPLDMLRLGYCASPQARQDFYISNRIFEESGIIDEKMDAKKPHDIEKFDDIMFAIFEGYREEQPGLFHSLMDQAEFMLAETPAVKKRVSAWVADRLSDLSLLAHCLRQIDTYYPWAATWQEDALAQQENLVLDFFETYTYFERRKSTKSLALVSLFVPPEEKFRYPVHRKTQASIEQMIRAETNLDRLWKAIDSALASNDAISPRLQKLLSERVLQRTPEWTEPERNPRPNKNISSLTQPLSELYFDLEHRTEATISKGESAPTPKGKTKTRGPAASVSTSPENPQTTLTSSLVASDHHQPPDPPTPPIPVDRRSFRVFRALFYIPKAAQQPPKEIPWADFLHAMVRLGFAAEKLHGSAWQFSPARTASSTAATAAANRDEDKDTDTDADSHSAATSTGHGGEIGGIKADRNFRGDVKSDKDKDSSDKEKGLQEENIPAPGHPQPALALDRSIQFHEPHPAAKMPYAAARRIGRRLARAYGWGGETFKLREG